MQPSPIADTSKLLFPSLRFCIVLRPFESRLPSPQAKDSSPKLGPLAYFDEVLAKFSELHPGESVLLWIPRGVREHTAQVAFRGLALQRWGQIRPTALAFGEKSQSQSPTRRWVSPLPSTASALEVFALSLNLLH